jgi:hypothetical protein
MFDFFANNPVVVLAIIFVLIRLLRGSKGNKTAAQKDRPAPGGKQARLANLQELRDAVERQSSSGRGGKARAGRLGDLKAALEDAMREADRQFSAGDRTAPADAGSTSPAEVPAALPSPAPADPYAFHSLMNRGEGAVADTSRVDYDTTATDYDTRGDAFAFRSSSREPVDEEYHLKGFKKFRRAGGISTDPVKVRAVGEDVGVEDEGDPLLIAIADHDQLRRAVILQEILERPLALRRR